MSSRTANVLAVALLLLAAWFRLWNLGSLPPGLHADEINDIRIAETARLGRIEVFYDLGGLGREGLYDETLMAATAAVGGGLIGYRILPAALGLLTLAVVYALAKKLYSPLAALSAMALLAVGLWPILLSRTVTREGALPLLLSGILLALASAFAIPRARSARTPTAAFTGLGVLLGIGFYIHPTHFVIALVTMLLIVYIIVSGRVTRRMLGFVGFAIVLMMVIAMPYVISSIRLPELAGPARIFDGFALAAPGPLRVIGNGLKGFFLEGDANPIFNLPRRPLIDLVSGLFVLVGLLAALRYWRQPRYMLPLLATLILLPIALLPQHSPSFPAMAVLLPLLALYFGVGVSAIATSLHPRARPLLLVALAALLVFNLRWTATDLFVTWPALPEVRAAYQGRLAAIARVLDQTADAYPPVVCLADLPDGESSALDVMGVLALMMHRENVMPRSADCGLAFVFPNGGAPQQVVFPDENSFLTVNQVVRDWLAHGAILDQPGLPAQAIVRLDAEEELARTLGRFQTTVPVAFAPESPGGMAPVEPPVRMGGNITFQGYEPVSGEIYRPGDYVTLVTYWRVDGILPSDLRLFAHVLLDPTTIAAQTDILSLLPGPLQPRDIFMQISFIRLPDVLPPGSYRLSVGAYEDNMDTRLPVYDGESERGTRLFLDTITVGESEGG